MRDRDSLILESLYQIILLKENEEHSWELLQPEEKEEYDYPWEILYPKNDEDFEKLKKLIEKNRQELDSLDMAIFKFRAAEDDAEGIQKLRNMCADSYAKKIPKTMYVWFTNPDYDMTEDQAKELYQYLKNGVDKIREIGMGNYTRKNLENFNKPGDFIFDFKNKLKKRLK